MRLFFFSEGITYPRRWFLLLMSTASSFQEELIGTNIRTPTKVKKCGRVYIRGGGADTLSQPSIFSIKNVHFFDNDEHNLFLSYENDFCTDRKLFSRAFNLRKNYSRVISIDCIHEAKLWKLIFSQKSVKFGHASTFWKGGGGSGA